MKSAFVLYPKIDVLKQIYDHFTTDNIAQELLLNSNNQPLKVNINRKSQLFLGLRSLWLEVGEHQRDLGRGGAEKHTSRLFNRTYEEEFCIQKLTIHHSQHRLAINDKGIKLHRTSSGGHRIGWVFLQEMVLIEYVLLFIGMILILQRERNWRLMCIH